MDKLKKVFTPGHAQDDEVMYGTPKSGSAQKDDFKTGKTDLASASNDSPTQPQQKEYGALKQDSNTGVEKYDKAATASERLQIEDLERNNASTEALKSGVPGPYAASRGNSVADSNAPEVPPKAPERYQNDFASEFSRETTAALGLRGAAAGAGALASEKSNTSHTVYNQNDYADRSYTTGGTKPTTIPSEEYNHPTNNSATMSSGADGSGTAEIDTSTYTARKFPLGGSSSTNTEEIGGNTSSTSGYGGSGGYGEGLMSSGMGSTGGTAPHVPGEFPAEDGVGSGATGGLDSSGLGSSGLGSTGTDTGGLGEYGTSRDTEPSSTYPGDTTERTAYPGDSSYPSENAGQTDTGTTSGGTMSVPQSTSTPAKPESGHNYGRDAAIAGSAGATGATGYGAYESLKDPSQTSSSFAQSQSDSRDYTSSGQTGGYTGDSSSGNYPSGAQSGGYTTGGQPGGYGSSSSYPSQDQEPQSGHHYGRDAGIVGGAGMAGAGAYAAYENTKDRDNTGPASKTIGPHSSNAANVMDPRVKPEPEKMKDSTTSGPYKSDMMNKMDPRVESDPQKAAEKEQKDHHYGRDAAVAGGAGAAGYGAYKAYEGHEDSKTSEAGYNQSQEPNYNQESYRPEKPSSNEPSYSGDSATNRPQHMKEDDSHKGRDAAALGGAGAAAYGADKAIDDKNDKKLEKAREKEEKEREKQREKEEKEREKQREKEEKEREKQREKDEKAREKEAKKSMDSERKPSLIHRILHPGEGKEKKSMDEDDRPKGLDLKEADEAKHRQHQEELGAAGAAGAAGAGAYEADKHDKQHNKLHKDPPTGYNQSTSNDPNDTNDGIVIEPHTGLPMNVGKFGSVGQGGTDGTSHIGGYSVDDPEMRRASQGTAEGADKKDFHHPGDGTVGPDWEQIRKANTPY